LKTHSFPTRRSSDLEEPVTWEIIMKTMKKNADNVIKLLLDVIPKIRDYSDVCIK
jgi:Holliday junction resolvase RusA-like endonuclease